MDTRPGPLDRLSLTIAQLNPIVGDIAGNAEKVRRARAKAAADGADLVVFSELFICGYPPEDLVLKPALHEACRSAIEALARDTADGGPAVLIGTPWVENANLYNAVALLDGGRVAALRFKVDLPNYGVFVEKRVFRPGPDPGPPPPWGMQNVLCRFRWLMSPPNFPGRARPTSALRLAPSM